jgi:hypothetical protein
VCAVSAATPKAMISPYLRVGAVASGSRCEDHQGIAQRRFWRCRHERWRPAPALAVFSMPNLFQERNEALVDCRQVWRAGPRTPMTYTRRGERYHGEPTAEQPRQRTQAGDVGSPRMPW